MKTGRFARLINKRKQLTTSNGSNEKTNLRLAQNRCLPGALSVPSLPIETRSNSHPFRRTCIVSAYPRAIRTSSSLGLKVRVCTAPAMAVSTGRHAVSTSRLAEVYAPCVFTQPIHSWCYVDTTKTFSELRYRLHAWQRYRTLTL